MRKVARKQQKQNQTRVRKQQMEQIQKKSEAAWKHVIGVPQEEIQNSRTEYGNTQVFFKVLEIKEGLDLYF